MTKNNKWPINTLDYIHAMIVDKQCTVVVDLEMSNSNNYAVIDLKYYTNIILLILTHHYSHV